jgi:hypothetical protein
MEERKYFPPIGNRTTAVEPVARRYTDLELKFKGKRPVGRQRTKWFCQIHENITGTENSQQKIK